MSKKQKYNINDNFDKMFQPTDPEAKLKGSPVTTLAIEKLKPFKNHPFKPYKDKRFADMVESIKANGIISPIIVRPLDGEVYEILSGHNRVEAAKSAEFEFVPVVIREDLSNDEALLIVTETNLIQRSFTDLSHSERAAALAVRHNAIKNQGKRTDLIDEIENLLKNPENISENADFETFAPVGRKLEARDKVAQNYNLSKNSVARYLRINKLVKELQEYVDNEEISIRAAVELSYIPAQSQSDLFDILNKNPELKVDIKKAELMRASSESNKLTPQIISDILSGITIKKKNRPSLPVQSLKIGGKILSEYFTPEDKPEDIQAELIEALKFYREHKKQ